MDVRSFRVKTMCVPLDEVIYQPLSIFAEASMSSCADSSEGIRDCLHEPDHMFLDK